MSSGITIVAVLGLLVGPVTILAVVVARRFSRGARPIAPPALARPSIEPVRAARRDDRATGPRVASGSIAPPIKRRLPGIGPTDAYSLVSPRVPSGRPLVPPKVMDFSELTNDT